IKEGFRNLLSGIWLLQGECRNRGFPRSTPRPAPGFAWRICRPSLAGCRSYRVSQDVVRTRVLAQQAWRCYTGGMAKKLNPPKKPAITAPAVRSESAERKAAERRLDALHRQVREILAAARERAWQSVNTAMVDAYWGVGRAIVEDEQAGKQRASYGKRVLEG